MTFNYRGMYRDYSESEIHLPVFEDVHSIQFTLRQVTELILRHKIDVKEAGLILYALQIASSNLKRFEREQPKPDQVLTDSEIKHPAETKKEAGANREPQSNKIDTIYGSASDAETGPDALPSVPELHNLNEFLRSAVPSFCRHAQAQRAVPPAPRCRRRCG